MSLPASIQAQIDQADAIQAHLNAEQNGTTVQDDAQDDAQGAAAHQDTSAPPQAAPQAAPNQDSQWEQRYKTMLGKYEAEVPRMAAELRETRAQLQATMAQLNAQQEARQQETKQQPLVTQQDVDTFGADLLDVVDRKAQEVADKKVAALTQHVKELEAMLGHTHQRQELSADELFYAKLGALVSDYKTINADQRWLDWLAETDPLTGKTRQDYLNAAAGARDANRVATIFNAFKQALPPVQKTPQQELQSQVAPSRSRGAGAPATDPSAKKVWSSKEITDFYTKVRMREISEADAARIESDINQAMVEGRIRQ